MEAYNSTGNFLIVPADHIENPTELPDDWWQNVKELINKVPKLDHYNISLNYGQNAGQTVRHLHFWIIPRVGGKPTSGRGLANLLHSANQT